MVTSVRIAHPSDATAAAALQHEVWRDAAPQLVGPDSLRWWPAAERVASWERWLAQALPRTVTLVVHEADQLLGLCRVGPAQETRAPEHHGAVQGLVVDPAVRGRGLGSQLLGAALEELEALGFQEVIHWVLASDARTRSFWGRAGFVTDGATLPRPDLGDHELRLVRRQPLHG